MDHAQWLRAVHRVWSRVDRADARRDERRRKDSLRDRLRVGLHWDVEVTGGITPGLLVSQVFCSALPVAYTRIASTRFRAFATLVLEAAYEATLWAAVLNAHRTASNVVYLTRVGGGVFGNETAWIDDAIRRALRWSMV